MVAVILIIGLGTMLWGLLSKAHGKSVDESVAPATASCLTMFVFGFGILAVIGFVVFAGCGASFSHH